MPCAEPRNSGCSPSGLLREAVERRETRTRATSDSDPITRAGFASSFIGTGQSRSRRFKNIGFHQDRPLDLDSFLHRGKILQGIEPAAESVLRIAKECPGPEYTEDIHGN